MVRGILMGARYGRNNKFRATRKNRLSSYVIREAVMGQPRRVGIRIASFGREAVARLGSRARQ